VSRLFYQPGAAQNGELPYAKPAAALTADQLGSLRTSSYVIKNSLLPLNPAALAGSGSATFRNMPVPSAPPPGAPPGANDSAVVDFLYTAANQTDDQVRCSLRDVGTFPGQMQDAAANTSGIAPTGAAPIRELRQDMKTLAQGAAGFNVPSLFGLAVGAPYFHAGNASTLESLFGSDAFQRHHQALAPGFLQGSDPRAIAQLIAFLLSIDENTALAPVLQTDVNGAPAEHDFCKQ
ncbi:MAG TPA: hypothetical protein VNW92_06950, partial [Polyangiaceae bacterium]|nr:hypothetical protein [Polyangiaceae bacterium]